jgi:hypothetical protein
VARAKVDTKPWEATLPLSKRDRLRAEVLERTPSWYNPWVHLGFPSLFGLLSIGIAIAQLHDVRWYEWLFIPTVLALLNVNEWHIHRNILHRRHWPLEVLFWRHTPEHHVIFVRQDMAMRATGEFRLVLIPAYGIVAIFVTTLPITAALWYFASHNLAALFVACSMGYVVSYEWLHLAYHLPASNPISRNRLITWLRHQHAVHHTPELMQRWNFNVTIPFGDWLLRTTYRGPLPG